jgi:hypothetical protein
MCGGFGEWWRLQGALSMHRLLLLRASYFLQLADHPLANLAHQQYLCRPKRNTRMPAPARGKRRGRFGEDCTMKAFSFSTSSIDLVKAETAAFLLLAPQGPERVCAAGTRIGCSKLFKSLFTCRCSNDNFSMCPHVLLQRLPRLFLPSSFPPIALVAKLVQ